MNEQAPSKEKMQEQLTSLLYAIYVQLDVNKHIPESVKTDRGRFYIRNWLTVIRDELSKFEEDFRASHLPELRADAVEALRPFVELYEKVDERYRKRGGDPDQFKDTHPFADIAAGDLPIGVWRRAQAAFRAAHEPRDGWPTDEHVARFGKWLAQEMPAGTVIGDPNWWPRKLLNAAYLYAAPTASSQPPASALSDQERHALWNAVEAARSGFAWTDPTGRKLLTELYERSALTKCEGQS